MTADQTEQPDQRRRVLDAAVEILRATGPEGLKVRAVAEAVGASTMAVYTHFGGMPELLSAVAREGFAAFAAQLGGVAETDDPLVDLLAQGFAYREFAVANPQLYRLMFGLTGPGIKNDASVAMTEQVAISPEGTLAFEYLVRAVTRARAGAPEGTGDALSGALQVWTVIHGYVLLEIAGYFGTSEVGIEQVLSPLFASLAVVSGVPAEQADKAVRAALARTRE